VASFAFPAGTTSEQAASLHPNLEGRIIPHFGERITLAQVTPKRIDQFIA
jgi:hypothetical protein